MDSKEFGLVAAQQLFQVEDLHYGFWDLDDEINLSNWKIAQKKHTDFLFKYIEQNIGNKDKSKLLDIGCGVGKTTVKLLNKGFQVDGLVPYPWMAKYARDITQKHKSNNCGEIYECMFEDFPTSNLNQKYHILFFSESFQYVNMRLSFDVINKIIEENGCVIIFDFFKKDNIEGKSPLGGGHSIGEFYKIVKEYNYKILEDIDVTKNMSPNMQIVSDVIVDRLIPFANTLDKFLLARHSKIYKIIKWLGKKKINKIQFKYSKDRDAKNFEKYKTYRLIVLNK